MMDLADAGRCLRLLRDRDARFTEVFDAVLTATGMTIVRTPVRAPRANAITERFVGTVRREILDRTLIANARHARLVLAELEQHLNTHRPHRALSRARAPASTARPHPPDAPVGAEDATASAA
jgi:transposase InsO family protein